MAALELRCPSAACVVCMLEETAAAEAGAIGVVQGGLPLQGLHGATAKAHLHCRATHSPWDALCLPLTARRTSAAHTEHPRVRCLQGFWWQLNTSDLEYVISAPSCLLHHVVENLLRLRRAMLAICLL
jgi:hypothetical protein